MLPAFTLAAETMAPIKNLAFAIVGHYSQLIDRMSQKSFSGYNNVCVCQWQAPLLSNQTFAIPSGVTKFYSIKDFSIFD